MLADTRGYAVCEGIASAETIGNVHSLLPSLQFTAVKLLEAAVLFEVLILIVVIVEIQVTHLIEATGELPPSSLPLDVACLTPGPPESRPCSDVITAGVPRHRSPDGPWTRRGWATARVLGSVGELKEMGTFHAVPVALGDVLEADATGVVRGIAAITEEQDVFTLGGVAYGAGSALVLFFRFGVFTEPLLEVKLGHLFLVLDVVDRNGGACN